MECERKIKPKITREIFTAFCLSSLHLSRQGGEEREKKKAMENQPLIVTMEIVFFRFYSSHHSTLFTRPTPNQFRWFMNKQFLDFSFSLVPPFLRTTSRLAFVDGNQTCRCRKAAWIRRGALEKPNNWIYYKLEIYILIWLALISAPTPDSWWYSNGKIIGSIAFHSKWFIFICFSLHRALLLIQSVLDSAGQLPAQRRFQYTPHDIYPFKGADTAQSYQYAKPPTGELSSESRMEEIKEFKAYLSSKWIRALQINWIEALKLESKLVNKLSFILNWTFAK